MAARAQSTISRDGLRSVAASLLTFSPHWYLYVRSSAAQRRRWKLGVAAIGVAFVGWDVSQGRWLFVPLTVLFFGATVLHLRLIDWALDVRGDREDARREARRERYAEQARGVLDDPAWAPPEGWR
ncbi:MAG: hypothetical protein AAGC46_10155 [Solirubrobacteraceae bacterium]